MPFNETRSVDIAVSDTKTDHRLQELRAWLAAIDGYADAVPRPASSDASFRRYFRVDGDAGSAIVMDAPPHREDSRPFVQVASYLGKMQLHAPRVLEADLERGFLLLTDLGSTDYLSTLKRDPALAGTLYADALQALLTLQAKGVEFQRQLPPFDTEVLLREMELFREWLCERHLSIRFDALQEARWRETCEMLARNALRQHRAFVHRDYHSRNLMVCDGDNPGILDFQDALEGPITYDLVSLLKDCYIRWPTDQVNDWALGFYEQMSHEAKASATPAEFLQHFELMGVQRQLKASGIFARLNHRDGKPGYLPDVPRTLTYIVDIAPRYPALGFLDRLIRERCLPLLQIGQEI